MNAIANKAARRLVTQHARQYEPEDPFYEYWTDTRGRERRRKRPPPPGLTKEEAKLLRTIQRRAHYLDKGFNLCGFRVGWTFFIGIIPGAGDIADACLNYFLVLRPSSKGAKLPGWVVTRMWLNNGVSAGIGIIPIAGDILLAVYKANSRNAKLLEEYFRVLGEEHIAAGMTGLTPQPPALPGQAPHHTEDDIGPPAKNHPAQPAARELVRRHSEGPGAAGGSSALADDNIPLNESAQAGGAKSASSTWRSKLWQRKND